MAAQRVNLSAEQGATFRQTLTVTAPPPSGGSPTPVDLTNATATMQIRAQYGSSSPLHTMSTIATPPAMPGIVLGGTAGTIALFMSASDTQAISAGTVGDPPTQTYVYDLFVTFASGDTQKIAYGDFTITGSVTR